jgi:anti-sigma B factor antagonist
MAVVLKRMLTSTQRMLPSAQTVADVVGALPLGILVSREENSLVVSLTGELDDATAPFLRETLAEITGSLNEELMLDISSLTFIDSTGLSLVVTLNKLLEHRGARLVILSPTPSTRRLFELTGLAKILTIWPSI